VQRLAAGLAWQTVIYEGSPVELVFATATGGLPLRQDLYSSVAGACERAGIDPTGVGTHTGRRSTVTALYVAGLPIDDVARHVGHSSTATTAGYVTDLGNRPRDTGAVAARLLDPTGAAEPEIHGILRETSERPPASCHGPSHDVFNESGTRRPRG